MTSRFVGLIATATVLVAVSVTWVACRGDRLPPDDALAVDRPPRISPDYAGTTIPQNIAPLNFAVGEPGQRFWIHIDAAAGEPIVIASRSPRIAIPADRWRVLLQASRGKDLSVEVWVEQDRQWQRYQPIVVHVADHDIDAYLAYRLIEPVHNKWREIAVHQRDLTTYRESVVLDGMSFATGCVNCHSFVGNDPGRMLIGTRSPQLGNATLLAGDGEVKKIGARFGYTAWHPSGRLAVYSLNRVWQFFHEAGSEVRDVIDLDSALACWHFERGDARLIPGAADKSRLETYPAWTPDGRYLYFCSAPMLWTDQKTVPPPRYAEVQYDLMRIPYDIDTDQWGEPEVVLASKDTGLSILLPRISPDGRFLLFCMSRYGCFPVFQPSSDLYLMDLNAGDYRRLEINSDRSESWHSWSSNSRWIAFSSKRHDGLFTRCYLSFVDETGIVHKPFLIPQRDPAFYDSLLKTVSVPELLTGPIPVTGAPLTQAIHGPPSIAVDGVTGASPQVGHGEPWQPTIE
jgi:hypothetical protein